MKRRILISMAVMLLSLLMCGNLWAESSGSCGDNITWTLDDDDNLTLTGSGQMADYNETYEHPWSDNVKTVKFAGDITGIGSSAFRGCSSLTSIEIPSSVTKIGEFAFTGCKSLKKVYITDLSAWCRITFNSLSANPLCNGGALYLNEKEVKDLVIPDDVTKIGKYAFSGCSSLSSIEIPNSVTSIGDFAFDGCSSLTSIEIPNSVTNIGYSAFNGCSSLSSIKIPNSVTSIGRYAFYGCSGLTSVTIGNSVTEIGSGAFSWCSSLSSIEIPNSVTNIGYSAFSGCSGLTSVTIGNSVTGISYSAFRGCNSLTSIEIPNSVTSIGSEAFACCSSLTSIEIPNSVTSIGEDAFDCCSSLKKVYITDLSAWYRITFNYSSANPLSNGGALYLNGKEVKDLVIPDDVTKIGNFAFFRCSSLTSIEIPNSVTSIGEEAFYDCISLTSVSIGNSVTSIGEKAFYYCNSLKIITVNATTPPDCGDYIFEGVDYSSCVLVVPDESISAYKNKSPWNQFLNISEVESVINDNEVSVKVENGNIVVIGIADDVNMEVYNIGGSRIYSGIVKSVQVPTAGLYLVKVLDKSYKIMVR